jgi:hypothetical protein
MARLDVVPISCPFVFWYAVLGASTQSTCSLAPPVAQLADVHAVRPAAVSSALADVTPAGLSESLRQTASRAAIPLAATLPPINVFVTHMVLGTGTVTEGRENCPVAMPQPSVAITAKSNGPPAICGVTVNGDDEPENVAPSPANANDRGWVEPDAAVIVSEYD